MSYISRRLPYIGLPYALSGASLIGIGLYGAHKVKTKPLIQKCLFAPIILGSSALGGLILGRGIGAMVDWNDARKYRLKKINFALEELNKEN